MLPGRRRDGDPARFLPAGRLRHGRLRVGVVERGQIVDGRDIQPGDVVIGLASSGLHSNGYSLVRKIVFERAGLDAGDFVPELGRTVAEELLSPRAFTFAWSRPATHYPVKRVIHGVAHITGGGLVDNPPRILPEAVNPAARGRGWSPRSLPGSATGAVRRDRDGPRLQHGHRLGRDRCRISSPIQSSATAPKTHATPAWIIGEVVPGKRQVVWEA